MSYKKQPASLFTLLLSVCLLSILLTNSTQAHIHGEKHDAITVDHARINPTVKGMRVTGVYLNISNSSHEDITLVRVTSTLSDRIELHEHTMKDGLMKMQEVAGGITIPAEESISLQPGGYHIMLMNLQNVVKPDDTVELTLHFSHGKTKTIKAKAMPTTNNPSAHHHH